MFYLKINRLRIKDTHRRLFLTANKGPVIHMLSIATTEPASAATIQEWLNENDKEKQRQDFQRIMKNSLTITAIPETQLIYNSNASIVFGDTGYVLFSRKDIPENINWIFCAIKSNQHIRERWGSIGQIISDDRTDQLISQAIRLLSLSAAGTLGLGVCLLLADTVIKALALTPDEQLGMSCQSFIRQRDYPYGERTRNGSPDTSGNMLLDYSLWGYNEAAAQAP